MLLKVDNASRVASSWQSLGTKLSLVIAMALLLVLEQEISEPK